MEAEDVQGAASDLEEDEEVREIEKILRWRISKRGNQLLKQYLITFKEKPIDEAAWVDEHDFVDPQELAEALERDNPTRDSSSL